MEIPQNEKKSEIETPEQRELVSNEKKVIEVNGRVIPDQLKLKHHYVEKAGRQVYIGLTAFDLRNNRQKAFSGMTPTYCATSALIWYGETPDERRKLRAKRRKILKKK